MLSSATAALARRPLTVGIVAVLVTALLAIPLLTMQPTSSASPDPTGPAFDARAVLDERLSPEIATSFFLVEARGASASLDDPTGPEDVLAPEQLRSLVDRADAVRASFPDLLASVPDPATGTAVTGIQTLGDLVDRRLAAVGGIDGAPDEEVRATTDAVIDAVGATELGVSELAVRTADGWTAPALFVQVHLDNEALGGGNGGAALGTDDTTREELLREVRDVFRGGEPGAGVARADSGDLVVHAVAVDTNLTAAEQGEAAGPFIGLVVLLTLLLVGVVFRSYWHVAIVGSGLSMLMVWLVGASNLIGLEQDQVLSIIVPIALVSFGVDFAFHALGRVREEREGGRPPRGALAVGLAGVGSALLLALASGNAAFLANVSSGIESIVQFGIAAAIGLTAAFLLLGVVAPTVETAVVERVGPPSAGRRSTAVRVLGALAAASAAMGAVLLTIFIAPAIGVTVVLGNTLLFVALPAWVRGRSRARTDTAPASPPSLHDGRVARWLGTTTVAVARRGAVVFPVVALVTALATWSALQIEAEFDVEDFFSADTDFVAGLDALDTHIGDSGGEPVTVLVEADLEDARVMARLAEEVDTLTTLDSVFATGPDGRTVVDDGIVGVVRDAVAVPAARAAVEATGTTIRDVDGDLVPDTDEGLGAVLATATTDGLPLDDDQLLWAPAQLAPLVDLDGDRDVARIELPLPGSRSVSTIEAATQAIEPHVEALRADLRALDPDAVVTVTGAPVTRQLSLDAVSRALLLSLPLALLACFAVALVAMRSLRHALIALVPITLVVPWLYGLMQALGFTINLVTGTIGAISIGIGIDFAIHLIERFREEQGRHGDRDDALRATAAGTGLALVASAASSSIGFGVLAFAPMPLFASYGLLTAIMIAMALVATMLVLPTLLRATAAPAAEPVPTRDRHAAPVA